MVHFDEAKPKNRFLSLVLTKNNWTLRNSPDLWKIGLVLTLRKLSKITLFLDLTLRKSDLKKTALTLRIFLKVHKFVKVVKVLSGGCTVPLHSLN